YTTLFRSHYGAYLIFRGNGKDRAKEFALAFFVQDLRGDPCHGQVYIFVLHQNKATNIIPSTARTTPPQFFGLKRFRNNTMPKRVENRTTPTNHVLNGIKGTDNWLNGRAFQFYRTHLVLIWFPIKSVEFGVLDSLSNIQTKDGFFAGSGLKGITNFHYPEYYMDNKM